MGVQKFIAMDLMPFCLFGNSGMLNRYTEVALDTVTVLYFVLYNNIGYLGLLPCYIKVIPSTAIAFCVYEWCKKNLPI